MPRKPKNQDTASKGTFRKGSQPEADRRADADDFLNDSFPDRTSIDNAASDPSLTLAVPVAGAQDASVDAEAHPDSRKFRDVQVMEGRDVLPGAPIPPQVVASSQNDVIRNFRHQRVPTLAFVESVETRGPLVPLVPLSEVHPSTVETAVGFQRIPNDQIHGVFEDANGVKRDALGHPFA